MVIEVRVGCASSTLCAQPAIISSFVHDVLGAVGLADRIHLEANVHELLVVEDVAAVEHECRLGHGVVDGLVV